MKPEGLDDRDQDRGQTKAPKSSWSPQHPPRIACCVELSFTNASERFTPFYLGWLCGCVMDFKN